MPNWITLTLADLNDYKVGELIEALRTEALAAGQSDPMPRFFTAVTDEVRGAIAFSGRYQSEEIATTVPKGLKEMAVKKVIRGMKGRLELPLSEDEKTDAATYEARLKALNEGKWPVDAPDTVLAPVPVQQAAGGVEQASGARRRFTADTLRNL